MTVQQLRRFNGDWMLVEFRNSQGDAVVRTMMPRHEAHDGLYRFTDRDTGTEWFLDPDDVFAVRYASA